MFNIVHNSIQKITNILIMKPIILIMKPIILILIMNKYLDISNYLDNHIACVIIAIPSSAINPKSHGYSIATISNRTLKEPVKMHYFGSRLGAISYNIKSSK